MDSQFLAQALRNIPERDPYTMERGYFYANPNVAGMAAEDDKVVINPYSKLSDQEKNAVRVNEAARIDMRRNGAPTFNLTPEQEKFLSGTTYAKAPQEARRSTVAARILSGDPSAGTATDEQASYVKALKARIMGN